MTQGAMAVLSNDVATSSVLSTLDKLNFVTVDNSYCDGQLVMGTKCLIPDAFFTNIYGDTSKGGFVLIDGKRKVRVLVKNQLNSGSVDEKFPYLFLNCVMFPEKEVIIVLDGRGYRESAKVWLERAIDNNWLNYMKSGKTIKLMSISEFVEYAIGEFS